MVGGDEDTEKATSSNDGPGRFVGRHENKEGERTPDGVSNPRETRKSMRMRHVESTVNTKRKERSNQVFHRRKRYFPTAYLNKKPLD